MPRRSGLVLLLLAACGRDLSLPPSGGLVADTRRSVAPRESTRVEIDGGQRPYVVELVTRASGGAAQVVIGGDESCRRERDPQGKPECFVDYAAGDTGDVRDVIRLTDSQGVSSEIQVDVGPALQVLPGSVSLAAGAEYLLTVTGGKLPYAEPEIVESTCTADCATARWDPGDPRKLRFLAGGKQSADVVRVRDAVGVERTAAVATGAGLTILPVEIHIDAGTAEQLQAIGGLGAGSYRWTVAAADRDPGSCDGGDADGDGRLDEAPPPIGLTISAEGLLQVDRGLAVQAGVAREAWVRLSDATGRCVHAPVDVNDPPELDPSLVGTTRYVRPRESLVIPVSSGRPPYHFAFLHAQEGDAVVKGNRTGASLTDQGVYTAGAPGTRREDLLRVTDTNGVTRTFQLGVYYPGINASDYVGVFPAPRPGLEQRFPILNGHLFIGGAHIWHRSDGVVVPLPLPAGRIHDVADWQNDGLPDVLIGTGAPDAASRTSVFAYYGMLDGSVALQGGGLVAAAATVVRRPGSAVSQVLSADTSGGCDLAMQPLASFLAGEDPPCAAAVPRPVRWLVKLGPSRVAAVSDGLTTLLDVLASGDLQNLGVCSAAGVTFSGPPVAVDLDRDGALDAVWVDETATATNVVACLPRPGTVLRSAARCEACTKPGPNVLVGPRRSVGGQRLPTVLLDVPPQEPRDPGEDPLNADTYTWAGGQLVHDRRESYSRTFENVAVLGMGDADGDGNVDQVVLRYDDEINLFYGSFLGTLQFTQRFEAGSAPDHFRMLAQDLDGDGADELTVLGRESLRVLSAPDLETLGAVRNDTFLQAPAGFGALIPGGEQLLMINGASGLLPYEYRPDDQRLRLLTDRQWLLDPPPPLPFALTPPSVVELGPDVWGVAVPTVDGSGLVTGVRAMVGLGDLFDVATLSPGVRTRSPLFGDLDLDSVPDLALVEDCTTATSACSARRPVVLRGGEGDGIRWRLPARRELFDVGDEPGVLLADRERARLVWVGTPRDGCDPDGTTCRRLHVVALPAQGAPQESEVTAPTSTSFPDLDATRAQLGDVDGDGTPELLVALSPDGDVPSMVATVKLDAGATLDTWQVLADPGTEARWRLLAGARPVLAVMLAPGGGEALPAIHAFYRRGGTFEP